MKSALKATLFMTRGAPFRERNIVLEVIMLKIPKSDKFGLFGKNSKFVSPWQVGIGQLFGAIS